MQSKRGGLGQLGLVDGLHVSPPVKAGGRERWVDRLLRSLRDAEGRVSSAERAVRGAHVSRGGSAAVSLGSHTWLEAAWTEWPPVNM